MLSISSRLRLRRRPGRAIAALAMMAGAALGYAVPATADSATVVGVAAAPGGGWWSVDANGDLSTVGGVTSYGSLTGDHLNSPIVGITATPSGRGYWMVASDGGIFAFGDAAFHGSTGGLHLNQPIVGMATTPDGGGYWLVASDGGIFAFGDAAFHGSTGSLHLNQPIVGIEPTPDAQGYWMVASDGGIFAFGDAAFHGSTGGLHLNQPIVGMATTPDAAGYWLVARDGGIFAFGDAAFHGTDVSDPAPALGVAAVGTSGYDVLRTDGVHVFTSSSQAPAPAPAPAQPTQGPVQPSQPVQSTPTSTFGAVGVSGTSLTLNGAAHHFVGVNAYSLGTVWGENAGCGGMLTDQQLDAFFASLPPGSLVRTWGLQGTIGTNHITHQIDWAPLDRVFAAAAAHGQYILLSLGGVGGVCDNGHWAQPDWYAGGFRQVYNDNGLAPMSYWNYVQAAVSHFRSSPALAMWEPYSEAEASTCAPGYDGSTCMGHNSCPDEHAAVTALRYFFDTVGGEIHALDPSHPVESGLLSGGQCGEMATDWVTLAQSPGLDVLSLHDYYGGSVALAGDPANGIGARLSGAQRVGKPLLLGEVGEYAAGTGAGCVSPAQRALDMSTKIGQGFADGIAGALPWNWETDQATDCSYNVGPTDPLMADLWRIPTT